ncbi:hypothetical protein GCM10010486_17660 [Nonomuraea roseoviolacea subsp. carminata]
MPNHVVLVRAFRRLIFEKIGTQAEAGPVTQRLTIHISGGEEESCHVALGSDDLRNAATRDILADPTFQIIQKVAEMWSLIPNRVDKPSSKGGR